MGSPLCFGQTPASSSAAVPAQRRASRQNSDSPLPARAASYLGRRRGILFFRSRIPDDLRPVLGLTEYRRSLNTARLTEARPIVQRLAVAVQAIYTLARAYDDHTKGIEIRGNAVKKKDIQELSPEHIRDLARDWLHGALTNANTFHLRIAKERHVALDEETIQSQQKTYGRISESIKKQLALHQIEYLSDRAVQLMVQAGGMNLTDAEALRDTDAFRLLCQELGKASVKFYDVMAKTCTGDFDLFDTTLEKLEESRVKSTPPPVQPAKCEKKTSKLPALSQAVEQYIKVRIAKDEWSKASVKNIPPCLYQFSQIISELENGKDIPIDHLNRQHMRDYTSLLEALPYRTVKQKQYLF